MSRYRTHPPRRVRRLKCARTPRVGVSSATSRDTLLLVDSLADYAIFLLDPLGRIVTWNTGAERILNYHSSEIVGQHFSAFYSDEAIARGSPSGYLAAAERSGRGEHETWLVRQSGERFCASVTLVALRGPAGNLRGFGNVTRDLTERRRAEAIERDLVRHQAARSAAEEAQGRIQESEERFRQLSRRLDVILQCVADGITVQDRGRRVVYANAAAARLFGLPEAGELAPDDWFSLTSRCEILDAEGRSVRDRLPSCAVLRGDTSAPMLVRVRPHPDTKRRDTPSEWWAVVRSGAVWSADGVPHLAVDVWHDVTAERRRERATGYLAEATKTLSESLDYAVTMARLAHLLVPALADWCAVDVVEGGELRNIAVAHVNPGKESLARELQSRYPARIRDPHGAARVVRTGQSILAIDLTDEVLAASAPDDEALTMLRTLGLRSAMLVPLQARGTTLGVMTLIATESGRRFDGEDLALAEELGRRAGTAIENARAYREARDAIRLREEFLSVAGHELKTPLTALLLQLQSVSGAFANGAVTQNVHRWGERAGRAVAQARRLERLVNELLDVSRITSGRLVLDREATDLALLVGEVVERHSAEIARSGSALTIEESGDAIAALDHGRVDQIVTNLLSNAIKYGAGKPIQVTVIGTGDTVQFAIHDHGIGIRCEDQARIFGRFERAVSERHYGGFGLGLWIVRELVEAHAGHVRFESEFGVGSTFVVTFPVLVPERGVRLRGSD